MSHRDAAVLVLALAMTSGCATLRPRWIGGSSPSVRPDIPADAVPMGAFVRGEAALQQNDMETAVTAFEQAVKADPDTPMLRLRLASLYVRAGQLGNARGQCVEVLKRQPDNLDALALLAGIDTALGRDSDAIAGYERLLALDPDYQEAYLYLGALYGKQGETERAVGTLRRLLQRSQSSLLATTIWGASMRRAASSIRPSAISSKRSSSARSPSWCSRTSR